LATLTAQQYRQEIGWNVIPIQQGTKNPKSKWKPFQDRLMTREEFQSQFSPNDGVAAICGQTSGNLAVLDFDHADAYHQWRAQNEELASRLPIATTSRGFHVFLRTPTPERKRMLSVPGFAGHAGELIGEGGYIVLPPTRHPSGASREWLQPPTADIPVVPVADLGVTLMSSQSPTQSPVQSPAVAPPFGGAHLGLIAEGGRHRAITSYAASLRARGLQSYEIGQLVHAENQSVCQPPLETREVDAIIQWAGTQSVGMYHHPLYAQFGMTSRGKATPTAVMDSVSLRDDEDVALDDIFKPLPTYLAELPADSYEWIIEGFMARGSLTIVGGNSKAGKTVLATNVAMAVATGTPFLGMPTTSNAVLWLAYEESEAERGAVLKMYDVQPENLFVTHEKLYLDSPEAMEKIRYWIRKTGAGLVIITRYMAHAKPIHSETDEPPGQPSPRSRNSAEPRTSPPGYSTTLPSSTNPAWFGSAWPTVTRYSPRPAVTSWWIARRIPTAVELLLFMAGAGERSPIKSGKSGQRRRRTSPYSARAKLRNRPETRFWSLFRARGNVLRNKSQNAYK